jgi:hypothetical protein
MTIALEIIDHNPEGIADPERSPEMDIFTRTPPRGVAVNTRFAIGPDDPGLHGPSANRARGEPIAQPVGMFECLPTDLAQIIQPRPQPSWQSTG